MNRIEKPFLLCCPYIAVRELDIALGNHTLCAQPTDYSLICRYRLGCLENADLENADLENTDLENTDLENPDLENADLENAKPRKHRPCKQRRVTNTLKNNSLCS